MNNVRVRFAPSPTGFFHIGSARTALFNWLYARHTNGKFILRIEDTDKERNTKEALDVLINGMKWLGLNWDEGPEVGGDYGPYFQSKRSKIYQKYLKILLDNNRAYEKDGAMWLRLEGERYFEYDDFKKCEIEKVKNESVVINDLIRGRVERNEDRDFVIFRRNGEPVFHFVSVVDDILMKITHVIRGEDHLSNTSKHIELYKAFNIDPPNFAHIPLILKENGPGKMSKRDKGALIDYYEKQNFLPEALLNYISLLGWNPKTDLEKLPIDEIISKFDFHGINKGNSRFDERKLLAMNSDYIKEMSLVKFQKIVMPLLIESQCVNKSTDLEYLQIVLKLCQPKIRSLDSLKDFVYYFFNDDFSYDPKPLNKFKANQEDLEILKEALTILSVDSNFKVEELEKQMINIAKQHNRKKFDYYPIIRLAVSGKSGGPDLLNLLCVLGFERVNKRLSFFIKEYKDL